MLLQPIELLSNSAVALDRRPEQPKTRSASLRVGDAPGMPLDLRYGNAVLLLGREDAVQQVHALRRQLHGNNMQLRARVAAQPHAHNTPAAEKTKSAALATHRLAGAAEPRRVENQQRVRNTKATSTAASVRVRALTPGL